MSLISMVGQGTKKSLDYLFFADGLVEQIKFHHTAKDIGSDDLDCAVLAETARQFGKCAVSSLLDASVIGIYCHAMFHHNVGREHLVLPCMLIAAAEVVRYANRQMYFASAPQRFCEQLQYHLAEEARDEESLIQAASQLGQ